MLSVNANIFKTSHPFSAILGTLTGGIIAWKFDLPEITILKLGLIFLLAQFLTGILNDYLDYESDLEYQPLKITSRGGITKEEIEPFIILIAIVLLFFTFIFLPWDVGLLIIVGTFSAQMYNIRLKDTPVSGIIFIISFGFMGISSYIIKYGYNFSKIPNYFIVSGLMLAIVAHIVNDLVDYEIDIDRKSNSMTIFFGRQVSIFILFGSLLLFLILQEFDLLMLWIVIFIDILVYLGIRQPNYKLREFVYYIVGMVSLILLYMIPVK
ncbi:MAG: UbiA family prenyltransferase [Candidatus Heimdallarchaeota archaeon]|nr:UbiA family prenyltransferase [Candidatus Heimdallarchaeota archaeon]